MTLFTKYIKSIQYNKISTNYICPQKPQNALPHARDALVTKTAKPSDAAAPRYAAIHCEDSQKLANKIDSFAKNNDKTTSSHYSYHGTNTFAIETFPPIVSTLRLRFR